MFNLREFVMKTLRGMAEGEPAYKVNRYALGWFERDVLTADDLAEIDLLTTEPEITEEIPEETQGEGGSEACPDVPEAVEETQEGETQTTPEETPDSGTEEVI